MTALEIMTAKEKANELGNKFYQGSFFDYDKEGHRKECERAIKRAIICVDVILNGSRLFYIEDYEYWKEVKEEIKKLGKTSDDDIQYEMPIDI